MNETDQLSSTRLTEVRTLRRYFGDSPILQSGNRFLHHQDRPVHPEIERQLLTIRPSFRSKLRNALSCYLALTSTEFDLSSAPRLFRYAIVFHNFIGAIHSDDFIELSPMSRYAWTTSLIKAFKAEPSHEAIYKHIQRLKPRTNTTSPAIQGLATGFSHLKVSVKEGEYWHSWNVRNAKDVDIWLPLAGLYRKYGREWTVNLYRRIRNWAVTKHAQTIPVLPEFCTYLEQTEYSSEELKSPETMNRFWISFWNHYGVLSASTNSSKTIITDWKAHWVSFVQSVLHPSGLFGQVHSIAGPDSHALVSVTSRSESPHISSEGDCRLLVDVPTSVSDRKALDTLLREVPESIDIVKAWCRAECDESRRRYLKRRRLRNVGVARQMPAPYHVGVEKWKRSRLNPDFLANAAATFNKYGFSYPGRYRTHELYPVPLADTAYELALPTRTVLLPFASLLVCLHPKITPSFLETLEIWDKNGKLKGLFWNKGKYYLQGVKLRKGMKAQQQVELCRESLRLVQTVLLLTREARHHLKTQGNDGWRRLFLTTGKGFGTPKPLTKFAADTSGPTSVNRISLAISRICDVSSDVAHRIAIRFSLRTLRTTEVLRRALAAWSESEIAKDLGHETTDPKMLRSYIPASLLSYFNARHVRRFQNCVIIFSTEGTPYQLRATGFNSYAEMEEFLEEHDLPDLKRILEPAEKKVITPESTGTFYSVTSEKALYCWASLAQRNIRDKREGRPSRTFGEIGERLMRVLEARREIDPILDDSLSAIMNLVINEHMPESR